MRVLVCVENIFSDLGGGQSFYADLMRQNAKYQFWYFSRNPSAEKNVPFNVNVIDILSVYRTYENEVDGTGFIICGVAAENKKHDLLFMLDLAASVPNIAFDIVDVPDFLAFGAVFPAALRAMGVKFDRVAVSLHGALSDGLSDNWADILPAADMEQLRRFEDILFTGADIRYAISRRYLAEREAATGVKGQVLDLTRLIPFKTFKALRTKATASTALPAQTLGPSRTVEGRPALAFIGRQEKWKGPDLFVDLVASLPATSFSEALLVGPETHLGAVRSGDELARMAQHRSVVLKRQTLAREDLWSTLAASRWVIVIPSRRDTFNLAALEAILTGTPTIISTMAGVCDFLDDVFPGLPVRRLDPADLAAAKPQILHMLNNFEAEREAITTYLDSHEPIATGLTIDEIYGGTGQAPVDERLYTTFDKLLDHLSRSVASLTRSRLRDRLNHRLGDMFNDDKGDEDAQLETIRYFSHMFDAACEFRNYKLQLTAQTPDQQFLTDEQMNKVWNDLEPYCYSANRIAVYRLLATLEKARGNALLYATYQIRCMRLGGRSDPAILEEVGQILRDHRFPEEADAVRWMYGSTFDYAAARAYLEALPTRFLQRPTGDIERVLDERTLPQPKISIIVSLYNAASKLAAFFAGLAQLTETTRATTEIVLIDSFSPDDTPEVVEHLIAHHRAAGWSISVNYIRTSVRETIQRAWNRGIAAAKGEYLSFLGVDEMNRPDAFDIMAEYLDNHPSVDWVQGTALVTEVNEAGSFVRDVMLYDRRFDRDFMNVFDTCYIGYVGALYRKAIHDRVGYYDDRFRGAGDSEFKNRALPKIVAVTLPICLGFFLNYPEERTTQSPLAEIEDIRAWYLYRTAAGVGYVFADATDVELELVFRRCMNYRKSYLTSSSTDLELATAIVDYVEISDHDLHRKIFAEGAAIRTAREMYRALDSVSEMLPGFSEARFIDEAAAVIERAAFKISVTARDLNFMGCAISLAFRNDNRSQQHHYLWRSRTQKDATAQELADVLRRQIGLPRLRALSLREVLGPDMELSIAQLIKGNPIQGLAELEPARLADALDVNRLMSTSSLGRHERRLIASRGLTMSVHAEFASGGEATQARCILDEFEGAVLQTDGNRRIWRIDGRAPTISDTWIRHLKFISAGGEPLQPTSVRAIFRFVAAHDRVTGQDFVSLSNAYAAEMYNPDAGIVWTGPKLSSRFTLPLAITDSGQLSINLANVGDNWAAEDLGVQLNGVPLTTAIEYQGGGASISGPFVADPEGLLTTELNLSVSRLHTPPGESRQLGVALNWIEFSILVE